MVQSNNTLRDRMLRDAIANVLVDAGRVGHVTVEGDRVVVELAGTRGQRRAAGSIAEVRQRLAALPELARADVAVLWSEPASEEGREIRNVGEIQ